MRIFYTKKEAERELDGAKILQICLKIYLDTEQRNVIVKKSNSIIHWDHFKPSNRDYPITNCLIQSNSYYQLQLENVTLKTYMLFQYVYYLLFFILKLNRIE